MGAWVPVRRFSVRWFAGSSGFEGSRFGFTVRGCNGFIRDVVRRVAELVRGRF